MDALAIWASQGDSRSTPKKDRNMQDVKFDCHISQISSYSNHIHNCFISDSYDFINIDFLSHDSITSSVCKSSVIHSEGCQSHGKACQVHSCPSKAMAETMDAGNVLGLDSKLVKLHRNLGDDFNMFSIFSI